MWIVETGAGTGKFPPWVTRQVGVSQGNPQAPVRKCMRDKGSHPKSWGLKRDKIVAKADEQEPVNESGEGQVWGISSNGLGNYSVPHRDPAYETAWPVWKKTFKEKLTYLETPLFPIILLLKAGLITTVDWPLFTEASGFQSRYNLHTARVHPRGGGWGDKGEPNLAPTWRTRPRSGVDCICPDRRGGSFFAQRRGDGLSGILAPLNSYVDAPAVNGAKTQMRP